MFFGSHCRAQWGHNCSGSIECKLSWPQTCPFGWCWAHGRNLAKWTTRFLLWDIWAKHHRWTTLWGTSSSAEGTCEGAQTWSESRVTRLRNWKVYHYQAKKAKFQHFWSKKAHSGNSTTRLGANFQNIFLTQTRLFSPTFCAFKEPIYLKIDHN